MKERFINAITHKDDEDLELIQGLVDSATWDQITALQKEKHKFVDALKRWRSRPIANGTSSEKRDTNTELAKDAHSLRMTGDGKYEMYTKGGGVITLTEGEVFAASEWGFWFKFDVSVPRAIQSKIMRHQVRRVIADQFDKQLIQFGKADRLSDDYKRDAYTRIEASEKTLEMMPSGILAEKMLMSLLTKEMHDHKDTLPFTVQSVDVFEDVEHKIDFIITVEDTRRGVKVDEPVHRIGIQFTTNTHAKEHKEKQLNRMRKSLDETEVDELILITMPINDVRSTFDQWRYAPGGRRISEKMLDPRGPDHLWTEEFKKTIIDTLVRGAGLS